MQNFTCTKCGSNQLRPDGNHFICQYCGATIFKPTSIPKKRLAFIVITLTILLIITVMLYRLLYSVKSDLQEVKTQQRDTTQKSHDSTQQRDSTQKSHPLANPTQTSTENPFSALILRVKSGYRAKESDNTLNNTLKSYHDHEKNKAFYISLQGDGKYAFGYAYGAKTTQEAEKEALKICEIERIKYNLTESCIPYAVNDNISRLVLEWQ